VGSTYLGSSSRAYTGNCPTPESLDAAGHRCGARSAASRPGGYSGYGTWATSARSYGTVNVRGYYRKNGTYVRSYSRRR
jgi:predicted secreted protein